jgi:hypothetical protein
VIHVVIQVLSYLRGCTNTHVNPSVRVEVYITTIALGGVVSKFTVLLNALMRVQCTKADTEGVIGTELDKRAIKDTNKNSGYANTNLLEDSYKP